MCSCKRCTVEGQMKLDEETLCVVTFKGLPSSPDSPSVECSGDSSDESSSLLDLSFLPLCLFFFCSFFSSTVTSHEGWEPMRVKVTLTSENFECLHISFKSSKFFLRNPAVCLATLPSYMVARSDAIMRHSYNTRKLFLQKGELVMALTQSLMIISHLCRLLHL